MHRHQIQMTRLAHLAGMAVLVAMAIFSARGTAGETALISRHDMVFDAVMAQDGIAIVPASDTPAPLYTNDHGPSQVLELVRPGNGPIVVERLAVSCSCLLAEMEKTDFAAGERAFIIVRKIQPSPQPGATFALFVGIREPVRTVIQYNVRDDSAK